MAGSTPAEAQLGGLMRRAREAAKEKTAEKDPRAPTSSTPNPFADPAIVFITQDQLARFEKALNYEIAQREALRKTIAETLASLKTQEEYQACSQSAAMSPEAMKISQDWADAASNAPDQMMKLTQKMSSDMGNLVTKLCGADPRSVNSTPSLDRIRAIEAEASDVAMPPGYTPPAGSQGRLERETPADRAAWSNDAPVARRANLALSYRASRPYFPVAAAGAAARAQVPNPHPFARAYGMLKERIPVFCAKLDPKAPFTLEPITINGEKVLIVKLPGAGQGYVYRQDEVTALTAGCANVMRLMNALFDNQ